MLYCQPYSRDSQPAYLTSRYSHERNHTVPVTTLRQRAAKDTYEESQPLILATAKKFARRYGGRYQDWMENINGFFMVAWKDFDNRRQDFPTYLKWVVWKGMLEELRNRMRRGTRVTYHPNEDIDFVIAPGGFRLHDLTDGMTDDAKLVVDCVLNPPIDVTAFALSRRRKRNTAVTPAMTRDAIREYLEMIGWSSIRISLAFIEVRKALRHEDNSL